MQRENLWGKNEIQDMQRKRTNEQTKEKMWEGGIKWKEITRLKTRVVNVPEGGEEVKEICM